MHTKQTTNQKCKPNQQLNKNANQSNKQSNKHSNQSIKQAKIQTKWTTKQKCNQNKQQKQWEPRVVTTCPFDISSFQLTKNRKPTPVTFGSRKFYWSKNLKNDSVGPRDWLSSVGSTNQIACINRTASCRNSPVLGVQNLLQFTIFNFENMVLNGN